MRSLSAGICLRVAVLTALAVSGLVATSSAAAAEPFGFSNFVSATCNDAECVSPFTQAAGHPPVGLTVFKLNAVGTAGKEAPVEDIRNERVDVPAGLSTNPEAVPQCSISEFGKEVGPGIFEGSTCSSKTVIGVNKVVVVVPGPTDLTIEGTVYNLERSPGVPAEFGVALPLEALGFPGLYSHTLIEGGVSWHSETGLDKVSTIPDSGDSHEFFEVHNIGNAPPLLESVLIYKGTAGENGKHFLTVPSACATPQISRIEAESYGGKFTSTVFPPAGELKATGCDKVPFAPEIEITPSQTLPDLPNGVTIDVKVPQEENGEEISPSALQKAEVLLPEGMTLNPAAANGLEACTDEQFGKGTGREVACPAGSKIGTVRIETPLLPAGSLVGDVYVGKPLNNTPSSGSDYRIFINAESKRYGVAVQLEGKVQANETTGRLKATISENPQTAFSEFILTLSNDGHTPLANPLICGPATAATFFPYTGLATAQDADPFTVGCGTPLFTPSQTVKALPASGGSTTSFTLGLSRSDGQQYLQKVSATLPAGMVAKIPSVPLCAEPLAKEGKCPAASEVGSVTTSLGSGGNPYVLQGSVYLTGPYGGAPYGLSIVVPAQEVGPYDYGTIVTQAGISVDPYTARVTVAGTIPTIVGGVPLRLKALTIAMTRGNFMLNPTSCEMLSTNTTLTSTEGTSATIATPFQATGCSSLAFKPKFSYSTNAYTTKRFGASLNVKVSETAGEANMKSVKVTLPVKLPSRTSTLKEACLEKTFAANPASCPAGAQVGTVKVTTPTLPGTLEGPAYFVSHGGAAFPDLDLVVKGDGVTVILVGNTNISKGITHTTFAALPDVPIDSFEMNLPTGEKSALAANGDFCKGKMYMPTTVVGQNGKTINEKIQIHVAECPVRVVGRKVQGRSASITAAVSSAGKLSTSGQDLAVLHKKIGKAVGNAQIAVKLSPLGERILATYRRLDVKVRVGFKSSTGAKRESKAFVKLIFTS
jgi:hypothetical protein